MGGLADVLFGMIFAGMFPMFTALMTMYYLVVCPLQGTQRRGKQVDIEHMMNQEHLAETEKRIEKSVTEDWKRLMGNHPGSDQIPTINTFTDYSIPTTITNHTR